MQLKSKLLQEHGLQHVIAGSTYNFRSKVMKKSVTEEYLRAVGQLTNQPEVIYSGIQVHGTAVAYADGVNGADDELVAGKNFDNTDGLITDKVGVALVIKYADCTPIIIYDPVKKVHASLHSGWRGTVGRIVEVAIDKMVSEFGCQLSDLVVYLGPSIDQANYEVGTEVYAAFSDFKFRDTFFKANGEKYLLSNIEAIYSNLLEYGFNEEQIEKASESTFTDERLHSARGEGQSYGLNAIITMMI